MIESRKVPPRKLRTVVIGAGMSGILAGIRLRDRGEAFVIYEKAGAIGGTWRENRYPGLTCDVPAHAYTYSFAPNPEWSAFYAPGAEIQRYFEAVCERHELGDSLRLGCEVLRCDYSDATGGWQLQLADGSVDRADVVIAATGVLHHPNIPAIPGLEDFDGASFHSARWPADVEVDGKRVGIIGNGSTGVQLVCGLAPRAKTVVHFQRSPQWIMPVVNFPYSEDDRSAFRSDLAKIDAIRFGDEYWNGIRRFNKALVNTESAEMAEIEAIVLQHLETSIRDPELREKLRPRYRAACKRLIYSPDYYNAVQQPSVTVEVAGIKRVLATGVQMDDGNGHPLDVLVLATGFKADRFVRPMKVTGRGNLELDTVWTRRPTAYLAISIPEFPNFFFLNGPTGPVGNFSLIDIAERQWAYIDQLLDLLRDRRATEICASEPAQAAYEERRIAAARKTIFGSGCTSWYLDAEGVPSSWPWSYEAFADAMTAPQLSDFDIR